MSSSHGIDNAESKYVLIIEGLPPNYTWREVKDLVRFRSDLQLSGLWAEAIQNKLGGTTGRITMNQRKDAENLYTRLRMDPACTGRTIRIIEIPMSGFDGVQSNAAQAKTTRRPSTGLGQEMGNIVMGSGSYQYQNTLRLQSSLQDQYNPADGPIVPRFDAPSEQRRQSHVAWSSNPVKPYHYTTPAYQNSSTRRTTHEQQKMQTSPTRQQVAQQQTFQTSTTGQPTQQEQNFSPTTSGIPVNISHGAQSMEACGIFIGNLHWGTTKDEIEQRFQKYGSIREVHMKTDRDGKFKGTATVLYHTNDNTIHAIREEDKNVMKGRQISVRLDKEATPVPTIVRTPQHGTSGSSKGKRPGAALLWDDQDDDTSL